MRLRPKHRVRYSAEWTFMPGPNMVTVAQLSCRNGLPDAPALLDIRIDEGVAADPWMLPGFVRRDWQSVSTGADGSRGRTVAVICHRGLNLSERVASWLHRAGAGAEHVEGGLVAWSEAGAPLVRPSLVPVADRPALIGRGADAAQLQLALRDAWYRLPSDAVSEPQNWPSASSAP